MDFVCEAKNSKEVICLIIESQTKLPTEDDINRFFQYVSTLRIFKGKKVELYILCTEKVSDEKKEYVINDDCTYTMHMISLKNFSAREIFNTIEDKLENNDEITDEDIASLQIIVYTDYEESKLEIINHACDLIERISEREVFDINEKLAILYLFDVVSANMLDSDEYEQYVEANTMLVNPRERYCKKLGYDEGLNEGLNEGRTEGRNEVARKMLVDGFPIEKIVELTGLSKEDILNAK